MFLIVLFIVFLVVAFSIAGYQEHKGGNPVWGHGIPISGDNTVRYGERYGQDIPTLSSMNKRFGPECCPSQYSTDRGCVCYS